jgi:uncharacterized protein with beta-barrel porin domain
MVASIPWGATAGQGGRKSRKNPWHFRHEPAGKRGESPNSALFRHAFAEGGYRFAVPLQYAAIGVTPYAALQTQWFHTPTYSETDLTGGGLGLSYAATTANDTRSELGTRLDDLTAWNNKPLLLRGSLAWAHDWESGTGLNAVFQSLPGSNFTVNGAPLPPDSALTSASAQYFFTPTWSFTAKFDGQFAPGGQTYAGSGTLKYTW